MVLVANIQSNGSSPHDQVTAFTPVNIHSMVSIDTPTAMRQEAEGIDGEVATGAEQNLSASRDSSKPESLNSVMDMSIDFRLAQALARSHEDHSRPAPRDLVSATEAANTKSGLADSQFQVDTSQVSTQQPDYRALQQLASSAALETHMRSSQPPSQNAAAHPSLALSPLRPAQQWPQKVKSRFSNYRYLAPAPPPRTQEEEARPTNFFDLPAEIRVEIYKLVVQDVIIHILPMTSENRHSPHALSRTSRQVRNEIIPIMHSICSIRANVTDFNFSGMLAWMQRIPPTQQHHLLKNPNLEIKLCTTATKTSPNGPENSLRKWLHMRADPHKSQPAWKYTGAQAQRPVGNEMRRKYKRMPEEGKRAELKVMLTALKVNIP